MELKEASTYGDALFTNQTSEEWAKLFDLNISSIFFVTTAFLGLLEASTKDVPGSTAAVINVSSAIARLKLAYARVSLLFGIISSLFAHAKFIGCAI